MGKQTTQTRRKRHKALASGCSAWNESDGPDAIGLVGITSLMYDRWR